MAALPSRPVHPALVRWHNDHLHFLAMLQGLERHATAMAAGDTPDYSIMVDILTYLTHYPDRSHHPREDETFARLRAREPVAATEADSLASEHRDIARSGQLLLDQLQDLLGDAVLSRAALTEALITYIRTYRDHIAAEEAVILPQAAALLTAADWSAVESATSTDTDPLFGDSFEARYGELRRSIASDGGPH